MDCALSYTLWKVSDSRAMKRLSPTTARKTRKVSTNMAAMASSMLRRDYRNIVSVQSILIKHLLELSDRVLEHP